MEPPEPEQGRKISSGNSSSIISGDLKIVLFWTALCILSVILPIVSLTFLRLILAIPMILFIPGYVLMAALFPDSVDIGTIERLVLSIGASLVVTPLIALLLNFISWGIRLDSVPVSLTVFIVSMVFIATYRRAAIPPESRYTIPAPEILRRISKDCMLTNQSTGNRIIFGIGVFAILMVIASTVLVISLPTAGDKYTEFFILGGKRTADAYPEMISPGILQLLYTGIGNHEYRTINYTVEVYLVPVNETTPIASSGFTPLESYSVILDHNQTSVLPLEFSAPAAGFYRMEFLLFNETVPGQEISGQDRINASHRNLHLQINATVPVFVTNNTLSQSS